jgi:two-component sensor histidine kinase
MTRCRKASAANFESRNKTKGKNALASFLQTPKRRPPTSGVIDLESGDGDDSFRSTQPFQYLGGIATVGLQKPGNRSKAKARLRISTSPIHHLHEARPRPSENEMRLLIVDDSPGDRKLCRILLEEAGDLTLEFLEAANGATGLEACAALCPDCVLIDYRLPDMTGIEFMQQLTSESESDRYAIVMLTGLGSGQVARTALKAGAHEYIMKDHLTAEELRLTIEKAITRRDLIRSLKAERDRFATLLGEKEVLLQEVHHRVKNNLTVIASLLSLQANTLGNEHVANALRASQHRVEAMALIHEQLYATEDLGSVDFAKHTMLLATSLFHSYGIDPGRVSWHVRMEPVHLGLGQAVPAGLILSELITNALKHAFPEGRSGTIEIRVARCSGRIELTVGDDGVGIDGDTNFSQPKSLGMQIVKILTRQLRGVFTVASKRPVRFQISFPEAEDAKHQDFTSQAAQSAGGGR